MSGLTIPLTPQADAKMRALVATTGSAAIAALDGATLLGERAMLAGFTVPGRTAAGGGCALYSALPSLQGHRVNRAPRGLGHAGGMTDPMSGRGWVPHKGIHAQPQANPPRTPPFQGGESCIALNLARPDDRELLPAWLEADFDPADDEQLAKLIAGRDGATLAARGREMGLALAALHENLPSSPPCLTLTECRGFAPTHRPRVLDLSALWAGPLATHLLALAGAEVTKVESRTRPDAMRDGQPAFFNLLDAGKRPIAIDWHRDALLPLIAQADIVIEASRPRALHQMGIDADALVRERGLVWITITAHGATGEAANWVGFGDDVAVAAGLSAELERVTGRAGFLGDAIADPLTGIEAAACAWEAWAQGRGGRYGVAMRDVVADAIASAKAADAAGFDASLRVWSAADGKPFPEVRDRRC